MTLKIAWLGPWNPKSSIGTMGTMIVDELTRRRNRVDVFRSEVGDPASLPPLPAPGSVQHLSEVQPFEIHRSYDAVVANIGDSFEMHGAILPFLLQIPAILIVHDLFLANLAAGWAASHPNQERFLRSLVRQTYGELLADESPYWTDLSRIAAERPMVEYFAGFGYGAVVHASHYEERVRASCLGPVTRLPVLVYTSGEFAPPRRIGSHLELVTVGHVNPNKRASEVIAALASSDELRRNCRYRIVGPVEDRMRIELEALAKRLNVEPPKFLGRVSEDDLRRYVEQADVMVCLRHPILEGSSGSMLVSLLSQRPTLVSDQGCYAEIPDEMALKCNPGAEAADVATHLKWILRNPERAAEMGRMAAAYAKDVYNERRYVDGLVKLIDEATPNLPRVLTGLALGKEFGYFGVQPGDPAVRRVAGMLSHLMALEPNPSTSPISVQVD